MSDSVTPRTVAYQASLSMGFSRQEYWSGLPFLSPEDLPDPGTEPRSPALLYPLSHQGSPQELGKQIPGRGGRGVGEGALLILTGPPGVGPGLRLCPRLEEGKPERGHPQAGTLWPCPEDTGSLGSAPSISCCKCWETCRLRASQ